MNKIIIIIFLMFISSNAMASTTWYAKIGGGTATQCTGLVMANYPGSGTAQACAFNHPVWAIGGPGLSAKMVGGDTLIIDSASAAQYMIGNGMPGVSCSNSSPFACAMNNIIAGIDTAHPTRILGSDYNTGCATKPQLWGTQSLYVVLSLYGANNVDIECLEITDHSNCTFRQGANQCSETYPTAQTYGRNGLETNGVSGLILKNLDIHGMSKEGMNAGDFSGTTTLTNVNMDGNGFAGLDGDDTSIGGSGNFNSGTFTSTNLKIRFSGCQEAYPRSSSFTVNDYSNCTDQGASGYGDAFTGGGGFGTLNFIGDEFSHNTQDGIDFLHANGLGNINIDKTLIEGNDGNQLKFTAKNVNLTNSIIIANCTYLSATGKVFNTGSWTDCRANGSPISASTGQFGGTWKFISNSSITGTGNSGSPFIEVVNGNGLCNGTETYSYSNNVLKNYNNTWTAYYSGLSGACGTAWNAAITDHSDIYNFTSQPSGTGVVTTNPNWGGSFSITAASNVSAVVLQNTSPGKGNGASKSYWNNSNDYNNFPQNSTIDQGSQQYQSSPQCVPANGACVSTSDCCTPNSCANFICSGGGGGGGTVPGQVLLGGCSLSGGSIIQ